MSNERVGSCLFCSVQTMATKKCTGRYRRFENLDVHAVSMFTRLSNFLVLLYVPYSCLEKFFTVILHIVDSIFLCYYDCKPNSSFWDLGLIELEPQCCLWHDWLCCFPASASRVPPLNLLNPTSQSSPINKCAVQSALVNRHPVPPYYVLQACPRPRSWVPSPSPSTLSPLAA